MNNRDFKFFFPNTIHHIYNRGNGKMDIFKDTQDFSNFIKRASLILGKTAKTMVPIVKQWAPLSSSALRIKPFPEDTFSILCHTLMPNHFHFIIRQNGETSISDFIAKLCSSYGKYFNKKYNHVGGLFQDQFKAVKIENDSQLIWTSAYIHNNPKTAGLVTELEDYPWSSYLDYIGLRQGTLCNKTLIMGMFKNDIKVYQKFVEDSFEKIKERKDLEHLLLDDK